MKAGPITIRPVKYDDTNHEFVVEVHTEDETHWGGYSRLNPFSGFYKYPKDQYILASDGRPK